MNWLSWLMRLVLLFCMVLLVIVLPGCMPVGDEVKANKALLGQDERGCVVLVLVDMSGSYDELMAEKGKAFELVSEILAKYFRGRAGSGTNDRIILGQLSAAEKPAMLFDGTPLEMRRQFPTPAAFRDWLKQHSDARGSRLHDGIREGVKYVMAQPGVAEGKTKSAIFVASDMDDNASDESGPANYKSINKLLGELKGYAQAGGNIALLYVEPPRCEQWRTDLRACGFKSGHFAVESAIVQKIAVPDFSDD